MTMPHESDAEGPTKDQLTETVGTTIGRYRLLEQIGEGGMGVVYVAEQQRPMRRRVALKLIKPGMDSKEVVARFAAERQALALMDHPNIAKVHDAGTTESGRPYFVMELVRGISITKYCDLNRFNTRERLELFVHVCQAVQHAHQKGIIHRDLKPSNVLITEHDATPVVKVIDFGVAKAINQQLTERTIYTRHQQMVGTPIYMSPEQAELSGLDVDTRSDIYSLGVVLYELLTGTTPFDPRRLREAGYDEIRRIIREEEPSKPSTKVRTLGKTATSITGFRRTDPSKLSQLLRGDMDWIVMKSLEKDRNRRYDTAQGLANDIERHLDDQPVVARPPSAAYKFHKFALRNKALLTSTAIVSLALVVGVGVATWKAIDANLARAQAQENYRLAKEAEAEQREAAQAAKRLAKEKAEALVALEKQEMDARRRAYSSDINLIQRALEQSNMGRARRLLLEQLPGDGKNDLRGWEWRYLWQRCRSQADFQLDKVENARCWDSLAVSDDGRWLACLHEIRGTWTPIVSIHDLVTRKPVAQMRVGARTFAMCARDSVLAVVPVDRPRQVELRNLNTNETAHLPFDDEIQKLKFSGDGQYFVIAENNQICRYRTSDWSMLNRHPAEIDSSEGDAFAVSQDGDLVAFSDGTHITVFNWKTGKVQWAQPFSDNALTALAFSHDGNILASGTGYAVSDITLWSTSTGNELARLTGHRSWVSGLQFWRDGTKLASSSSDQTIRLWDISQLNNAHCVQTLLGHTSEVWQLALLADQSKLFSGGKNGEIVAWDLDEIRQFDYPKSINRRVFTWAFTAGGRSIGTVDDAGRVEQWTIPNLKPTGPIITLPSDSILGTRGQGRPTGACFSDNGQLLAVPTTDGTVYVWDVEQGAIKCKLPTSDDNPRIAHFWGVKKLLLIYADLSLHLWNLTTQMEQAFPITERVDRGVWTLSPNQELQFVVDTSSASGQVINLNSNHVAPFSLDTTRVVDIAFTKDGKRIAVASQATGAAELWNLTTRQRIGLFKEHLNAVHSVAFSPDDRRLATGGGVAEAVKIWDVESQREMLNLEGEGALMSKTRFSADGNTLVTLAGGGQINLWHAPSWQEIDALEPETTGRSNVDH